MQAVATGELGQLLDTQPVLHDIMGGAVQNFLTVPAPYSLPRLVWINLKRVEDHYETGWAAVSRFCLSCELLRQLEVVLHGASHKRLLE